MTQNRDWYKNARVTKKYDGRVKLSDNDKSYIKKLYHVEKMPIREIARIFEGICSRSLIRFVLFPERALKVKKQFIARKGWKKGNLKENHTPAMRKYRTKLKALRSDNLIK